ncbi:MAG: hypothetical protein ABDH28_00620 [Brevinematia bacterium]
MSKFPKPENFKNHKTLPQKTLEEVFPYSNSYLFRNNIFPRKFKKCYIYDILEQKFTDFFLDRGRYYLGFSDKYLTKMVKNYLKTSMFSYSKGVFSYRFTKLLKELTGNRFEHLLFAPSYESLCGVIERFVGGELSDGVEVCGNRKGCCRLSLYDQNMALELKNLEKVCGEVVVLDLGYGLRYPEVIKLLQEIDFGLVILWVGRFFVILLRKEFISLIRDSDICGCELSEFDAMFGYYYLMRERFLVTKKLVELRKLSQRWLGKFVDLGIATLLTPYSLQFNSSLLPEDFNLALLREGILSYGNTLFFSFQHEENDFKRLRRKLNQIFGIGV